MSDSADAEPLFVRLYFDRHIMARLAVALRGRGFDVLRTEDAGNDTASDEEQLAFATAENRALLTSVSDRFRSASANALADRSDRRVYGCMTSEDFDIPHDNCIRSSESL